MSDVLVRIKAVDVIQATNLEGLMVYSKGKLISYAGEDHFYFFVSSKRAL